MTKEFIEQEIKRLTRDKNMYRQKRSESKERIAELEELINKLNESKRKADANLENIYSGIRNKSNNLNPHSKFRDIYLTESKKILRGKNYNQAIYKMDKAISNSKKKILSFESDADYYKSQERNCDEQIRQLKQQLAQLEVING